VNHEKKAEFYFTHDTTIAVGKHKFETYYPGEGHTKDNIIIWFEDEKILCGGCLVKSTENTDIGYIADANMVQWEPTIKTLIKKYPKINFIIPGHFGWENNSALKHTLQLLQQYKSKSQQQ
jgi:glyoxylase-like metal-dependent hydrolase (beta-lactamase superfamily II)